MKPRLKIGICDDDPLFQIRIKNSVKDLYDCFFAKNGEEGLLLAREQNIQLILLDINMRYPREGLDYIKRFLNIDQDLCIIISSNLNDFDSVREAMRLGATDYLTKDAPIEELLHTLDQAIQKKNLVTREKQQNYETLSVHRKHVLVGESKSIIALKNRVVKARESIANVIILGETGTGKELVARQLRKTLPNGSLAPFAAVDSSTIQASTAESLLFGHEKGAFTGADRTTKGIFEEANGGIVYFDEISNMPLEIQVKLLRVLQEKEICRLGSNKRIELNFKVVCATNSDLEALCHKGQFKFDLFQRLNVIPIHIPPLRERMDDFDCLLEYFIDKYSTPTNGIEFSPNAISLLKAYAWPGNVRELENLIAYLTAMADQTLVKPEDLPPRFHLYRSINTPDATTETKRQSLYETMSHYESNFLKAEYDRLKGNIRRMAQELKMDRSHLYSKLRRYGIHTVKQKVTKKRH